MSEQEQYPYPELGGTPPDYPVPGPPQDPIVGTTMDRGTEGKEGSESGEAGDTGEVETT